MMAVERYENDYDESLAENLGEEMGPDLATAATQATVPRCNSRLSMQTVSEWGEIIYTRSASIRGGVTRQCRGHANRGPDDSGQDTGGITDFRFGHPADPVEPPG
jgi:hypothetical protein